MKKLLTILLVLFCFGQAKATHIVGGELSYSCLGNNDYLLTLKVYRDCFLGQAAYDNPTTVTVFDASGNLVTTVNISFPGSDTLPNNANSPCLIVPPNICVEEATFTATVNLPPIPGGYTLVYQRCCRNSSILNLNLPSTVGASYYATIPDATLASCNNSPHFNNFPPTVICANVPFTFDHSATDADGDSLVYHLCEIVGGGNQSTPYPVPAAAPPYIPLLFVSPYTYLNPMGGAPPIAINPSTGLLTVTPTNVGQFSVGICVDEYRNGQYLDSHYRDFQFNVTPCTQVITAGIGNIPTLCDGLTANFSNTSNGGSFYHWDFGVLALTTDTSNLFSPTYSYLSQGTYGVSLIVNPGSICADTATAVVNVHPTIFTGGFSHQDSCSNAPTHFQEQLNANNGTINQWSWNFGDGGFSSAQNPNHTYISGGTYNVQLIVTTSLGCSDTVFQQVTIYDAPSFNILTPDTVICDLDSIQLICSGTNGNTFQWTPNYFLNTASSQNPVASPNQTTTYYLTVSNQYGCITHDTITVYVITNLTAVAGPDSTICFGDTLQLNGQGGLLFTWVPATSLSNPIISNPYAFPTVTTTYVLLTSAGNCFDYDTIIVSVKPLPVIHCGPDEYICPHDSTTITCTGATDFLWAPASTLNNAFIQSPNASPLTTTTYYLTATDSNSCLVSVFDSLVVFVYSGGTIQLPADTTIILGESTQLFVNGSAGSVFSWLPVAGLSNPNIANPVASPTATTTYYCTALDNNGCVIIDSVVITVLPEPVIQIPNAFSPNNDGNNDLFRPIVLGLFTLDEFRVYNRWGQVVFETHDLSEAWNGKYKNTDAEVGVYVYTLSGHGTVTGTAVLLKGNVTLLR